MDQKHTYFGDRYKARDDETVNNTTASILAFPKQDFSSAQDKPSSSSEGILSNTLENPVSKKTTPAKQPVVTPELLKDLQSLSKTELRKKYSRESNSHKNRKSQCKKNGGTFADEFDKFCEFLLLVGVCPGPDKWTLDRIDNNNPDYFPGGVRWANAKTQNNNKSDTKFLTYKGKTQPLTAWAEETGQKPDTLRKRLNRGWPDHEVIWGRPKVAKSSSGSSNQTTWRDLIPGRDPDSYRKLEAAYQQSSQRNHTGVESRQCWLGAVAVQHLSLLKEELVDLDFAGAADPELQFQYDFWEEIVRRINQSLALTIGASISDYPHIQKGRKVGRISWCE